MCTELCSCCDVTDQQASHGSRETVGSCYARLHRQFLTASTRLKRDRNQRVVCISSVHQQRHQLLHLPGREQGFQERDEDDDKRHVEENSTWKRAEDIRAALI